MSQQSKNVRVYPAGDFHWVGNGFPVRSVFSYNDFGKELSPFLLLDYAAPYEFEPGNEKRGVAAHPHKGFETVTIAYQGEIEHRDSSGAGGKIGPGDVQWMTAASGLIHEEFHSESFVKVGGKFEMVQLWVNLPKKYKNAEPGYQTLVKSSIPTIELASNAGELRVIAGEAYGRKGPARTVTPINILDAKTNAESEFELNVSAGHTKLLVVMHGDLSINEQYVSTGELAVIDQDVSVVKINSYTDCKLLILTGEPIEEPIVGHGPFVMNTEAEIRQAFMDYKNGKMGALD